MKRTTLIAALIALSLLGLADSWYLANAALTGSSLTCDIEGLSGCNVVAQSSYSHFFGVPLGVYGLVYYVLVLILALVAFRRSSRGLDRILAIASGIGILASLGFVYIQIALIRAVCVYCLGSAVLAALIAFVAFRLLSSPEATPSA